MGSEEDALTGDVLWAPWRIEYIRAPKGHECVFCAALESPDDRESLVLWRGAGTFVILNRYPYTAGHLMVVPKRHVPCPEDLDAEEAAELWREMVRAKAALQEVFQPDGFNVGFNLGRSAGAGVKDHLHLHVVPRWTGDTNFMPVLGATRVISQHLTEIFDSLARRLASPQPRGGDQAPSQE